MRFLQATSEAGRAAGQDELVLLERICAGDAQAFDALYRAYQPRLKRFIGGMTRQPGLVEEVLDDTMMVVWHKAPTYNGEAKVSTWIFAIAYRQTLKALRRHGDEIELAEERDAASSPEPDVERQQQELHRHLGRALAGLSAEQRAVIELTYYLGYGCREIARIMDCPVDTVKTRMFYARRKLRTLLELKQEEAL
ncbi:MAG TPA: sigma-70 family RNA polymerase sigma factor [Frateuria sp.]|uniref:RNA polymerase sigma factor n=1 Tax=Frateuria sp. TaxID=2211372 RepID=UPI002D7F4FEC|nr:sigma-70 family RNA polymerase sigma factor [Frateuria sp.]HET6804042.1 sigma-70 family RNA polymerase sigma factor [Frateuria sp.]